MVGTEGEDCCGAGVGASREVLEGFMAREGKRERDRTVSLLSFHEIIIERVVCVMCHVCRVRVCVCVCVEEG